MTLSSIQLPFQFDPELLENDLQIAAEENWKLHYNTRDYTGAWKVIALMAPGGDSQNTFAMNIGAELQETPLLKKCAYFQQIISSFQCPVESVRLLSLEVGAEIKPHSDFDLGYEDGVFRVHVPITTNPGVEFILDGKQLRMLPGECWYTNVNFIHSVANRGSKDRVHLVMDFTRNDWSDLLFFSVAPAEHFERPPQPPMDRSTRLQVIEALRAQNNPKVQDLIDLLEKEAAEDEK